MEPATKLPTLTEIDTGRIARMRSAGEFFWLDLEAPTVEQLTQLSDCFGIHELALEDVTHFGQRPKVDEYGDHVALVYFGVLDIGAVHRRVELMEMHVFIHGDFVVTVHREAWPDREHLRATFDVVPLGSEQLVIYRILDALTDSFFPLVERFDREIEDLEQAVVKAPRHEHTTQVMALKRDLAKLRRTVGPQREVAGSAVTRLADVPGLQQGPRDYFRDVYDHMIRIDQALESSRVLLSDVLSVHMARSAQRQNTAMERLTVVSTIFLPLSFVVGFYGQNFKWMTDAIQSRNDFLVFGIGGLALSTVLLGPVVWTSVRPMAQTALRRRADRQPKINA